MAPELFNWNNLLPIGPHQVVSDLLLTDRSVSSFIIWFMITVCLFFCFKIWTVTKYAIQEISKLEKLYPLADKKHSRLVDSPATATVLKGDDQLRKSKLELEAIKINQEYLEYLEKYPSSYPDDYWNLERFGCNFSQNRFIASLPSFLTAFGVLGTFIGLQAGLGAIPNLGVTETDELLSEVFRIISKAQIAFSTSLWGVLTSLILSMYEKIRQNQVQNKINDLIKKLKIESESDNELSLLKDIKNLISENNYEEKTHELIEILSKKSMEQINSSYKDNQEFKRIILEKFEYEKINREAFFERMIKIMEEIKSDNVLDKQNELNSSFFNELKLQNENLQRNIEKLIESASLMIISFSKNEKESINKTIEILSVKLSESINLIEEMNISSNKNQETLVNANIESLSHINHAISSSKELAENFKNISEHMKINEFTIQESSNKLNIAADKLSSFGNQFNSYLTLFKDAIDESHKILKDSISPFEDSFHKLHTLLNNQVYKLDELNTNIESIFNEYKEIYSSESEHRKDYLEKINEIFIKNIEELISAQEEFSSNLKKSINDSIENGNILFQEYLTKTDEINASFSEKIENQVEKIDKKHHEWIIEYSERVAELTAKKLDEWDNEVGSFASNIHKASEMLSGSIDNLHSTIDDHNSITEELIEKMKNESQKTP